MGKLILIFCIIIASCTKSEKSHTSSNQVNSDITSKNQIIPDDGCVDFVALWSAGDISEELGIDKRWVFRNYTVDIWDIPPSDPRPGDIVGELRASSYARIIDRTDNDYLVESPMTKVHGWLNKSHVKMLIVIIDNAY